MDPWEGIKMCEYMEANVGRYATEDSYWRGMVMRYRPKTKKQLQDVLQKKETFKMKIEELRLIKGGHAKCKFGRGGAMLTGIGTTSRGCSARGGGRKDHFKEQKEVVNQWALKERQHGHSLT